jgi:hypothetical protein
MCGGAVHRADVNRHSAAYLSIVYFIVGFSLVAVTAPLLAGLLVVTIAAMITPNERTLQALVPAKMGRFIILVPSHNEENKRRPVRGEYLCLRGLA